MNREEWQNEAIEMLKDFPKTQFLTDEFRAYAYDKGLSKPEDERSWGGVITKAKSQGIISKIGYDIAKYENSPAHSNGMSLWKKL